MNMENEKREKINIIDDEIIQNKFLIILKEGNPYSSPELEQYAWKKFVEKVERGDEEISSVENDVKKVVDFCVDIKKEYYAQHNIETDIEGNPNVKETLLENPELVKENVEFARIVEESFISQKIDYKELSIFELENLINISPVEKRIEIFSNYFGSIYTNEDTEKMRRSFSEIFSNGRLNKIYNSFDIENLTNEERKAITKFIGEKGKNLSDDELLKILREKIASVYMIKSFEKNKFEIGNINKEDLPKIYKVLSYLSKAEEGTEEKKVFEASILGIVGKNISIEDALKQVEVIFEGMDPNFHENLKNEHKIAEDFSNIEQYIKNTDKDQFFEEAKKISNQYIKEKYERYNSFSDLQKLMYDRISSIDIVPNKKGAIQYARNAEIIVKMYEKLNSKESLTNTETELKEVLDFYIKLQENRTSFAKYITETDEISIKNDAREDAKEENGSKNENIINDRFINNLIKNLENADKPEKGEIVRFSVQEKLSEETNLCRKINLLNKDVIPEELFARYTILKEKISDFSEENSYEKNMLRKEFVSIESFILENFLIIKQYYTEIGKEDYINKILIEKEGKNVINYDSINKEDYIKVNETSPIYDLCIDIVKLSDRRRFEDVQYSAEIEAKKERLEKLIDSSKNKEKYEKLFFEKNKGIEQISENKIIKDVNRLTTILMGYKAADEISYDIKYGKEFTLLSTDAKAQYLKNIIILMNNKENETLKAFTNSAVERICRTGVDLRDNTGEISEEKIVKFYNSFVAENQKIKFVEGVIEGRKLEKEYKIFETYSRANDIDSLYDNKKMNERINSIIKDEKNISQRDASYVIEIKETLNENQLKINNVFEKIDLNEESNKETIINLYWVAKNKALSDIERKKENPSYVIDEENYRFYKDLREVIKLDTNRIAFSNYLKGNHIITCKDRDICNAKEKDSKELSEITNEKISSYRKIIEGLYKEDNKEFEQIFIDKLDEERNKEEKISNKEINVDASKKEREILETLKQYKKLINQNPEEVQKLSSKEQYAIDAKKIKIEKKIATDPAYKKFCNLREENGGSAKERFNLEKIEKEIDDLEKKLDPDRNQEHEKPKITLKSEENVELRGKKINQPIKDSEINPESIVELNATAVEEEKNKKVKEAKISDSEIETKEFEEMNVSAIDAEIAKDDKRGQEDEEVVEKVEEASEENESKNNLFTNITNSVKAFINRVTVPKLTDGTENGIKEEKKEGFFTNLFNKTKVNKTVHEEKNPTDENKFGKEEKEEENNIFGTITINSKKAIEDMKNGEGMVKSGEENGER